MKVIHLNEHLARKGGVETYMLALLPMLRERGVTTHVLYGQGDASIHEPASRVAGIGEAAFGREASVREEVRAILERERADVVHVHNVQNRGVLEACLDAGPTVMTTHDFRAICPANMFFHKRTQEECGRSGAGPGCFVTTLHKHCLTPRPAYALYFYRRSRWTAGQAGRMAHVIAPSAGARDRLVRAGWEGDRVTVLPYFCPLEPADRPRQPPDTPTITFMGRIAPNKGQEYFVEALGQLPDRVQGVMVGSFDRESEASMRRLAAAHGCAERLTLHPWASRAEVLEIFDRTSVFVFPSLWPETLGIVGLEALSRGVPVVASDVGGVREWLRDGENGYLVPPKNAARIREAVLSLLASDERLQAFGECGIRTIRERFSPSDHADRIVHLYERVAH